MYDIPPKVYQRFIKDLITMNGKEDSKVQSIR